MYDGLENYPRFVVVKKKIIFILSIFSRTFDLEEKNHYCREIIQRHETYFQNQCKTAQTYEVARATL